MGQELNLGVADPMTGILAKKILVGITLGFQDFSHAMVGLDPVVHAVAHHIRVERIIITHRKEQTDGFLLALGN